MIIYDEQGKETPEFRGYQENLRGQLDTLAENIANFVREHNGDESDYFTIKDIVFRMWEAVETPKTVLDVNKESSNIRPDVIFGIPPDMMQDAWDIVDSDE